MSRRTVSTRRSFIRTAGAALSVPLAAAAANAPVSAADVGYSLEVRLARLEDVEAIRALNQEYARTVNAGDHEALAALFVDASQATIDAQIRGVAHDGFGERDVIDVAPDRLTATGVLHCTVEFQTAIEPDCPLVEMARQQGGGVVRRTERGVFENVYVRRDGVWKTHRSAYRVMEELPSLTRSSK